MPAPVPDQNWLGANWEMFATGFAHLSPGSAEVIRDGYGGQSIAPGYENYVSMPWESPFWVYPGNLSDAERTDMYNRMIGAPDAEMAGSWGRMMNAIDNVQDVLVSVGLLGALGLWAAGSTLGPLGFLVGGLLFLADLLAALTTLGQLLSVLYALLCNGLAGGLAAAVPAALFSKGAKGKMGKIIWNNPSFRTGFFRGRVPAFGLGGAFGLVTQLPQATSTLFGYGIALGGVVGTITGGATGIIKGLLGEPVHTQFNTTPARRIAGINTPLASDRSADRWMLGRAANVMATAPTILRYPEAVPPGYYLAALTALDVASHYVYKRLHGHPWQEWIGEAMDEPLEHSADVPRRLEATHTALGIAPGVSLPWDYPGNPTRVTPAAYVAHVAPSIGAGVDRWLGQNRMAPFAAAAGESVNRLAELSTQQLLDDERPIRWELTPDAAILEVHATLSRVPAQVGDLQRIWSYWQELRAEAPRRPTAKWTGEYLDAVADRHGVKLIRFLPPDRAWPQEWRDWLSANEHAPRP